MIILIISSRGNPSRLSCASAARRSGRRGGQLIAPADGQVLLAEDLGGTAGNTIVIDHGAGVKSIFYCLNDIAVEAGDTVRQGETLGTTKDRTILEVRVGQVAVDPLTVLRNQSAALRS